MNEDLKTMWIVSSGDYSDYSIWAICPTREVALAVAERANLLMGIDPGSYRAHDVAEKAFVDDPSQLALMTISQYRGWEAQVEDGGGWKMLYPFIDEGVVTESHPSDLSAGLGFITAAARTQEQAHRIAQDRAAQLKAEREGLT